MDLIPDKNNWQQIYGYEEAARMKLKLIGLAACLGAPGSAPAPFIPTPSPTPIVYPVAVYERYGTLYQYSDGTLQEVEVALTEKMKIYDVLKLFELIPKEKAFL
ncbi:hypothetical protein BH09SUM1_BH09SUM1_13680 [soil metagenome]